MGQGARGDIFGSAQKDPRGGARWWHTGTRAHNETTPLGPGMPQEAGPWGHMAKPPRWGRSGRGRMEQGDRLGVYGETL